jgi:hypothetical protein
MVDSFSDGNHLRIDDKNNSKLRLEYNLKKRLLSKPTTTLEENDDLLDETNELDTIKNTKH